MKRSSGGSGDITEIKEMQFAGLVNVRYERSSRIMDDPKIWKNVLPDGKG